MQGQNAFRLHKIDISNQVVVIRVIGERKRGIDLVTIDRVWIDRPATDHGDAFTWNVLNHRRMTRARRANEHSSSHVVFIVADIFTKRLPELLVNARHLKNGAVQHRRQSCAVERA